MKAKINIKSLIDGEEFLGSYDGSVTFSENVTLLTYEENVDSCASESSIAEATTCKTNIRILSSQSAPEVIIEKTGALNTKLHFLSGTKTSCQYNTPFGSMPLEIETEKLEIIKTSEIIKIALSYRLLNISEVISSHILNIESIISE